MTAGKISVTSWIGRCLTPDAMEFGVDLGALALRPQQLPANVFVTSFNLPQTPAPPRCSVEWYVLVYLILAYLVYLLTLS